MQQPVSPGVLIYNGRSYAVGLLWFTVQEEASKALLQERIKNTHADFYCNRLHISQQQGFGTLAQGHRRGMPVAAAMVADQLVGEWHGVFEADNGWWYVQVRSDTIMPHGDRFFANEEDAYNVFQDEMTKHNWPHAYAPAKWRLGEAVSRELPLKGVLDDFASTTLVASNMAAVFGGAKRRNLVFAALGGILMVMAGMMLTTVVTPTPVAPVSRQPVTPRPAAVLKKPAADTLEIVAPGQLIQYCGNAAATLMVPLPGWRPEKFTCQKGSAAFLWMQFGGTLASAREAGATKWPANVRVTLDKRVLRASLAEDRLPMIQPDSLPFQDDALVMLESDLQPLGAVKVKPVTPVAPPPPKAQRFATMPEPTPTPPPPP